MGRKHLILGGAKSGKSDYALGLAESLSGDRVFIATAETLDDEMTSRVAAHQAARGAEWRTIEAPFDLVGALASVDALDRVIVVDCLTLWLSNLMTRRGLDFEASWAEVERLAGFVGDLSADLVMVSNEVGWGVVPGDGLTRAWRDLAGRTNQVLAGICNHVVLVVAGLALELKKS